jgi:hypothetical protein
VKVLLYLAVRHTHGYADGDVTEIVFTGDLPAG